MLWQRIVELHSGEPRGVHGSGYLLAPGLVLTARHVVDGLATTRARLLEPDEDGLPGSVGEWQAARVAWRGDNLDLALLEPIAGAPPFHELQGTVTIARLDGRAPVQVDALGFPRAVVTASHSDTLHIGATVNAWSGVRGEALLLDVGTTRPAEANGWKGMSGAAVFAGDRLVGVIEAVPTQLDGSTLRATPAHTLSGVEAMTTLLRQSEVEIAQRPVDAAYVDALPRSGDWSGLREDYARRVVTALLRIDYVGLAVGGAPDRKMPALSSFTDRRLRTWPDDMEGILSR